MDNIVQKVFNLNCDCLGENITFIFDDEIYISCNLALFNAYQRPVKETLRRFFKMIWYAISGKEYRLYDIVIGKDRLEEFKKFIANL